MDLVCSRGREENWVWLGSHYGMEERQAGERKKGKETRDGRRRKTRRKRKTEREKGTEVW